MLASPQRLRFCFRPGLYMSTEYKMQWLEMPRIGFGTYWIKYSVYLGNRATYVAAIITHTRVLFPHFSRIFICIFSVHRRKPKSNQIFIVNNFIIIRSQFCYRWPYEQNYAVSHCKPPVMSENNTCMATRKVALPCVSHLFHITVFMFFQFFLCFTLWRGILNKQEAFEKCWAQSPQRAASRPFSRCC